MIQKSSKRAEAEGAAGARESYQESLVEAFKDFNVKAKFNGPEECGCDANDKCVCGVGGDFITRTFRALEESVGSKVVRKNFTRKWYNE